MENVVTDAFRENFRYEQILLDAQICELQAEWIAEDDGLYHDEPVIWGRTCNEEVDWCAVQIYAIFIVFPISLQCIGRAICEYTSIYSDILKQLYDLEGIFT